jgi:hypothetical protein
MRPLPRSIASGQRPGRDRVCASLDPGMIRGERGIQRWINLKRLSGLSVRFVSDRSGKVLELAFNTPNGVFSAKRK